MVNVPDKICTKKSKHIFMFHKRYFFFENLVIYEIIWKNIVEPDRPQMTIWRMRTARWIPKATHKHSEYFILVAFPLQQWLQERAWILGYTYIACLVYAGNQTTFHTSRSHVSQTDCALPVANSESYFLRSIVTLK